MAIPFQKFWTVLFFAALIFLFLNGLSRTDNRTDFEDYYNAGQAFTEKSDLYNYEKIAQWKTPSGLDLKGLLKNKSMEEIKDLLEGAGTYLYPPTFAFLLQPLSAMSYETASRIFFVISFLLFCATLYLLAADFERKGSYLFLLVLLLINFRFIENHQNNNQVGILLVFLILFSYKCKNDWLSGMALGLAIAIKVTPIIFLFYFLWTRQFKRLVLAVFFCIVWLFLPGIQDWDFNLRMLSNWYEMVIGEFLKHPGIRAWKNNQSLPAVMARYFSPFADPIRQMQFNLPLTVLSASGMKVLNFLSLILLGLPFAYRLWKGMDKKALLSLLFILSVILSGISWIHAFVFFLFPSAFLLDQMGQSIPKSSKILFILSYILFLSTTRIISEDWENALLTYGSFLFASILLYASIVGISKDRIVARENI